MASIVVEAGAAAMTGLAASGHCVAMCGPLAVAACVGQGGVALRPTLAYGLGRTVSYGLGGALAGTLGAGVAHGLGADHVRQATALALAAAITLTAVRVGRSGERVETLVPLRLHGRAVPARSAVLGLVNGLLPCGALASGLMLAAGTASAPRGALAMAIFAAASAPGLALAIVGGRTLGRIVPRAPARTARRVLGAALLALAAWVAVRPWTVRRGCHCATAHTAARASVSPRGGPCGWFTGSRGGC